MFLKNFATPFLKQVKSIHRYIHEPYTGGRIVSSSRLQRCKKPKSVYLSIWGYMHGYMGYHAFNVGRSVSRIMVAAKYGRCLLDHVSEHSDLVKLGEELLAPGLPPAARKRVPNQHQCDEHGQAPNLSGGSQCNYARLSTRLTRHRDGLAPTKFR